MRIWANTGIAPSFGAFGTGGGSGAARRAGVGAFGDSFVRSPRVCAFFEPGGGSGSGGREKIVGMHSFPPAALLREPYQLSDETVRAIASLAGQGIILDSQLFKLFEGNPQLRILFELFLPYLKRPLTETNLESALKLAALEHPEYGPRLDGFEESGWDVIASHLGIDFHLRLIEGEAGKLTLVSARRFEELQGGGGAAMVLSSMAAGSALAVHGAAAAVAGQMARYFEQQFEQLGPGLIGLQATTDEDDFLKTLNALLPLMMAARQAKDEQVKSLSVQFIQILMARYAEFGREVRLAIVAAFKKLGFDEEMMDSLASLSSKADPSQVREAINQLVAGIGLLHPKENLDQIELGLIGLYKFLDDVANSKSQTSEPLAVHALGRLKPIAPLLIGTYLHIKPAQILEIAYKLLNKNIERFAEPVEELLAEIGEHKRTEVERWLLEKEGIAENGAVKAALLRVLRRISPAENQPAVLGRQIRLYIGNEGRPVGARLLAEFQSTAGEVLPAVIDEFDNDIPEARQPVLIRLMDALYTQADDDARRNASGFLADMFGETPVRIASTISEAVRIEVLKTGIVLNAEPQEMGGVFAPAILQRLAVLLADERFVQGLVSKPGAYYRELCHAVTDDARAAEERIAIAEIAIKKGKRLGDSPNTDDLRSGVLKLFRANVTPGRRRDLFSIWGGIAAIPAIPGDVIVQIFDHLEGEMGPNPQYALKGLKEFVSRKVAFPRGTEKRLLSALRSWTIMPPGIDYLKGLDAEKKRQERNALFGQMLEVHLSFLDKEGVPAQVQGNLVDFLLATLEAHPQPEDRPYPARDALLATLRQIAGSRHLDGAVQRALQSTLARA